jgi:hypothetical protein
MYPRASRVTFVQPIFRWHSFFSTAADQSLRFCEGSRLRKHAAPKRTFRSLLYCTSTDQARLFCFDVTRREILHEVCFSGERSTFRRALGEASIVRRAPSFRSRQRVRTRSASIHIGSPSRTSPPSSSHRDKAIGTISFRYASLPLEPVCCNRNHSCACAETERSVHGALQSPATCPWTQRCRRPPIAALSVRCSIA